LLAGGEFYGEQHEKLWVNCLNRVVSKMEQMPNTVKEFVWEHLKLSSKLDRESATHLAKKWLKDDLTGFKEVMVKQTSSSTVFEKKLITVEEESLDARDVELYYFPFYHVEGDQGSIYIDAVTGDAYHSLIAI
jgi:CRISPR/Cas system type I-B associated protein Csh2 (Cas7 group RAMP superfamily)